MANDLSPAPIDALDDLRRRAEADPQAALALGRRLLAGDASFAPLEGADWVARAAKAGAPEALRLAGLLAALGVGQPQSWTAALDHLTNAADRGDASARSQLSLLAGAAATEQAAPAALRGRIDLAAWLNPPPRVALSEAPRVRSIESFLPSAVCRWIQGLVADRMSRALMFNPNTQRDEPHPGRTNTLRVVGLLDADVVFELVRARISAAVKIPLPCFEPTQILHYQPGQEIAPHYDFLEGRNTRVYGSSEAYQGQRIATFLCYLNDDYEGGATTFPKTGLSFRGKTGDALFFANVDGEGKPDRLSLHAGTPPTRGEKWTLSQWIHNQTFNGVLVEG
jgi:prolyl 4-hydroxylase